MSARFPHWLLAVPLILAAGLGVRAQDPSPFDVTPSLTRSENASTLRLAFRIPTNSYLYADHLSFELGGQPVTNLTLPAPVVIQDKFSGEEKRVFPRSFEATTPLPSGEAPLSLVVHLQGCDEANCYFPEERAFTVRPDGTIVAAEKPAESAPAAGGQWKALADQFEVRARGSGYLGEKGFLALLDEAQGLTKHSEGGFGFKGWGLLATLGLIFLGGLGLNLTPCVLPMIPINLAIIGAGAQSGSKARGFVLGGTYGAGMAVAYGVLGLAVVLTGSKFGTLNASPWFNLVIAVVFLGLALAMFDVFVIDLSRFQGRGPGGSKRSRSGQFLVAYSMGTVAALLAGACVAPVVISVLVQSTTLYNQGAVAGLFLPFLLGFGMALPWPFAGAGLSFLPKPGGWMTRVKQGFGVLIVLFAGYYGMLAFNLFRTAPAPIASASGNPTDAGKGSSQEELIRVLTEARRTGRPVFVDFWASWCKNCSAMEHTTFKSGAVKQRLGAFLPVRFQAERLNQTGTREVLDHFGVFGLPTYVFLTPRTATDPIAGPAAKASTADPTKSSR